MKKHFQKALKNISRHGDTDVFPYPLENVVFYDCEEDVAKLLVKVHQDFDNKLRGWHLTFEMLGYTHVCKAL